MIRAKNFPLIAVGAAVLLTTACTVEPGENTRRGAITGGILGGVVGAISGDDGARDAIRGAAIGAAAGGAIGYGLDAQEAELRRSLGNSATITNTGDRLIVSMSQDILFATDSSTLATSIRDELRSVAASLQKYPESRVQVLGHTDNTGEASYNLDLSQRRAAAVSSELISSGVSANRIQTIGRGEDQPVASNLTPEGRAQNRRVEIVILPTT
ncbi:OmpA family protein [Lutimaribacter sp. EGI FJ00015]|uniref:OmpA family protein n=1 Tax=Lutimaribacter degradans TaxID=2945989 RepID=A0ACC5ZXN7_9RHOB|nr:OmpA family protein [Lutimaribacter sp. EGI FJ00013]MCM2562595.1 OmpA family protein [Lutimaribacter sp. EGI FJ00013]MCO0613752.1 OmpA family protein [Lutimaribacter sp. EGI FJ00015]MCO0636765.1 OmpA family protein [Lutimaribacter sp. EGI FJ00014]